MTRSPKGVVVLDACVLYPAPVRDLLLNLADFDLYTPKWTDRIQQEWTRNLLINRPELTAGQLQKTVDAMDKAFPDATVSNYEPLIASLHLLDQDDRHVLAAAIHCHADVIATTNLKDFPAAYLSQFDIQAQHPDYLIATLIDLKPEEALRAFQQQLSYLKRPPLTEIQLLDNFRKVGLIATADKLADLL